MNKELKPYSVHLICNAKYHDSDFARLEILKLLAEHDDIYTTVSDTYDNFDNHIGKNLVITAVEACALCAVPNASFT